MINIKIHHVEDMGKNRERLIRLRERVILAKPTVELDRARLVTEFYQENENLPVVLKRAGALAHVFENTPVYVRADELIVGSEGPVPGSVQIHPEYSYQTIESEIDKLEQRFDYNRFYMGEEQKKEFREVIVPYWKGRTNYDLAMSLIPEESHRATKAGMISFSSGLRNGTGHTLPKYVDVVARGTEAIVADLEERRNALDLTRPENIERALWYQAAAQIYRAIPIWAKRHANEARSQADKEADPERRKELLEIARICDKVPAKPAETFHEALQALWFAHVAVRIESAGISISMGRFDQDFYPYLKRDLEAGRIDMEQAEELLECLWVKFNETNMVLEECYTEPYVSRQALTIGGVTPDGFDATNDLTYLCLKVQESVGMHQPSLSLRCHPTMPDRLLMEGLRVIRRGAGLPALFNDEAHILGMMNRGAGLRDARDYAVIGCVEAAVAYKSWTNCSAGKFNLPKCLMLALYDGLDITTGEQLGPHTGDSCSFETFDELLEAYRSQVAHFVQLQVRAENAIELAHAERAPVPLTSVLIEDCIENGRDVTRGGAKYNWTAPQTTGQANTGDCLTAIRKAVFDDHLLSMAELLEAMGNNFENQEKLRQRLLNAPKYGNDDDYADLLVREALRAYTEKVAEYRNTRGGMFHAGSFPGLSHIFFGKAMGATADGRRKGEPFATGVTPVSGRDVNGVTATVNSAGKLDYLSASNGTVLTLWFHPSVMKDERGLKNIAAVVRSYFDRGGQEIQFNVVSADVLKEAQKHPDQYRSLVVRVTGWSSFFVGLSKAVQDEIIERTEFYEV